MSTWEERMSSRAKARADEEQQTRKPYRVMVLAHPPQFDDPQYGTMSIVPGHEGHISHMHGAVITCSCDPQHDYTGWGVASVVVPDDWIPPAWCGFCDAPY